jgi:general secretion pathway protein A
MYLNFFNLNREPFQITPDPSFLYLSRGHKEALASIIYGVEKKKGFILIIGAVGVGKTTILRAYLERSEQKKLRTIYLFNANISYANLLKYIFRELAIIPESVAICDMVNQLHRALIEEYRQGRNVLLLIDEAQNMPVDTLENLRMLSNLETATEKLIQIVFCGQPEFEMTLKLDELKQLRQRIAVKAVILPLSYEEGLDYIGHRLKKAADKEQLIFTSYALREIVRAAKGIPRVINVISDNTLITAFGYGRKKIGISIVKEITRDLGIQRSFYTRSWVNLTLIGFLLIAAIVSMRGITVLFTAKPVQPFQVVKRQSPGPTDTLNERHEPTAVRNETSAQYKPSVVKSQASVDRVVEKGDTLAKLVKNVYGHVDKKMIRLVKQANPHIENENLIVEGRRIVFPIKKTN